MPEQIVVSPGEGLLYFQALECWRSQGRGRMIEIDPKQASDLFFKIAEDYKDKEVTLSFEESRDLSKALSASPLPKPLRDHLLEQLPVIAEQEQTDIVPLYGSRFHQLRDLVLRRDGGECQRCGMTRADHQDQYGFDLHIHHKKPVKDFDKPRNAHSIDNLVTLCAACHQTVEGGDY